VTPAVAVYVTVTLMTFEKQSNGRRTAVESKSNRSCNHPVGVFQMYADVNCCVLLTTEGDADDLR